MTEPTVEEIVAQIEATIATNNTFFQLDRTQLRALIASWRERGAMIDAIHAVLDEHDGDDAVGRIRDVLYGGAEDKI